MCHIRQLLLQPAIAVSASKYSERGATTGKPNMSPTIYLLPHIEIMHDFQDVQVKIKGECTKNKFYS